MKKRRKNLSTFEMGRICDRTAWKDCSTKKCILFNNSVEGCITTSLESSEAFPEKWLNKGVKV